MPKKNNPLEITGDKYWQYYINLFKYALYKSYKGVTVKEYNNIYSTALTQLKKEKEKIFIEKKKELSIEKEKIFIEKKISNGFIILVGDRLTELNIQFKNFSKEKEYEKICKYTLEKLVKNVF